MESLPDEVLHRYPLRNPETETLLQGEGAVIVHPGRGLRCELNETAARIWQLCNGKTSLAAAVDAVCEEFDADRYEASRDAVRLVRELESGGFLRMLDEPAAP